MIEFNRSKYLQKLIAHKHNRLVKIVTGVRRCGKSYLLFNLFNCAAQLFGICQCFS